MISDRKRQLDIYIVGTTAVGKTKLSLAVAKHLQSEIVSCDSMQLYRHADIMTAKATAEEQKLARHHMIDVLELDEGGYNRNKYYEQASGIIKELHARGQSPILVGGTNYYIETLLFDIEAVGDQPQPTPEQTKEISRVLALPLQEKYKLLREVDPLIAEKLHPNDQHRVDSYLRKYIVTGEKPSTSYSKPTDKLRNANTLLFWIRNSDREELRNFMGKRINDMINRDGLVEILAVFGSLAHKPQQEGGVLQSIGYKEFAPLVESVGLKVPKQLTKFEEVRSFVEQQYDKIDWEQHRVLIERCKEELLTSTFQYAKRQVTWIRNRLFDTSNNHNNFFVLELSGEGSLAERFEQQVKAVALNVIDRIVEEGFGTVEGGLPQSERNKKHKAGMGKAVGEWRKEFCGVCNRTLNGRLEYEQHLRTARHKKLTKAQDKKNKREAATIDVQEDRQGKHEDPKRADRQNEEIVGVLDSP